MQGHIAARSDVERRTGVAVRGDPNDRSVRAILGGEVGGQNNKGVGWTVKDSQTLGPLSPGTQDSFPRGIFTYSQKTLTSAAASVWPKGLRTWQVYRAWSLRTGREMSSWSRSARMRGGSAPSRSGVSRACPSLLQLSSPLPGFHPTQLSRSSAAPSSVSGALGCTDNWGKGSGDPQQSLMSWRAHTPEHPPWATSLCRLSPSSLLSLYPESELTVLLPLIQGYRPQPSSLGPGGAYPSPQPSNFGPGLSQDQRVQT